MYELLPPEPQRLVALVLAADPGEGFDATRWLAPWSGTTLLDASLASVRAWQEEPGVVILGYGAEEVLDAVDFAGFVVVIDPEWAEGESASLRVGVDYLMRDEGIDGAVVVDAAVPTVDPVVVQDLMQSHIAQDRPLTMPKYRYARGRPVIVARSLWTRLLGFEGDTGLDPVIETHPRWINEVWLDSLPPAAITTPDDLVGAR